MNTRQAVLAAIRDAGGRGVSGEDLARHLGISRTAVAKHVATLRDWGYEIQGAAGAGYALRSVPDLPLPDEVAHWVEGSLWADITGGGPTISTNDDAKALARAGAPEGTAVIASEQRGGRGRFARVWSSPPGGVYLSAVLRPSLALAESGPLPLVLACGVARGLHALGIANALKWPNDVVLPAPDANGGHRKLAGLLVEVAAEADALEWAVVGVGVNVRRPASASPEPTAAYAEELLCDDPPPLARVAAAVLDGMASAYLAFVAQGFDGALREEYEGRSVLGGSDVVVHDRDGRIARRGRATGVDEYGRLILRLEDGQEASVSAGDVSLRADRG